MEALEDLATESHRQIEQTARRDSHLSLCFRRAGSVTRMSAVAQDPPWRVIRAFPNLNNQAVVHLHNVSGGVLAGDSLRLTMEAQTGAQVQVTSVGATRIYKRGAQGSAARLRTTINVGEAAFVEYLPDQTIPFANSSFEQSMNVMLAQNAGFIYWETVAAGRVAHGEEFAFESMYSACTISSRTRPIAIERYRLVPASADPRSIARWGHFRYTTALYICHTGVRSSCWSRLECLLNEVAFAMTSSEMRWGASTLIESGLIVRGLSLEAHQASAGVHEFWKLAKRELWGQEALPPRKIN